MQTTERNLQEQLGQQNQEQYVEYSSEQTVEWNSRERCYDLDKSFVLVGILEKERGHPARYVFQSKQNFK